MQKVDVIIDAVFHVYWCRLLDCSIFVFVKYSICTDVIFLLYWSDVFVCSVCACVCSQWKSDSCGRSWASPHIKSYTRVSPNSSQLAWFLVTRYQLFFFCSTFCVVHGTCTRGHQCGTCTWQTSSWWALMLSRQGHKLNIIIYR